MATANIILTIPDLNNQRTLINPDPRLPTIGYIMMGHQTHDTFLNKTIIDPSNDIAATKLTNGTTVTAMNATSIPAVGKALVVLPDGTLGWGSSQPAVSASHVVYVSKAGNDTTGTGTSDAPFLTINAALTSITTASATNKFVINIGPGQFDEVGNIVLKPWVFLNGSGRLSTKISSTLNTITVSSAFNTGTIEYGLKNLSITGTTTISVDLILIGGTGAVTFFAESVNGVTMTYGGRTTSDVINVWDSEFSGAVELDSATTVVKNCYIGGLLTFQDLNIGATTVTASDNFIVGGLTFTQHGTGNSFVGRLSNNHIGGALTLAGTGSLTVAADVSTLSAASVSVVSATLTKQSPSVMVTYTAAAPTHWATSAPVDVQTAIDRMSSLLYTLNTNTPIP